MNIFFFYSIIIFDQCPFLELQRPQPLLLSFLAFFNSIWICCLQLLLLLFVFWWNILSNLSTISSNFGLSSGWCFHPLFIISAYSIWDWWIWRGISWWFSIIFWVMIGLLNLIEIRVPLHQNFVRDDCKRENKTFLAIICSPQFFHRKVQYNFPKSWKKILSWNLNLIGIDWSDWKKKKKDQVLKNHQ